ncbi:sensor domain-containing phosphodiesterase [Aquabacterium sp.]|uniref:sensor domain-containing phosphodiesterase n=1 Tax=Aquabacterium sp. TaxID=1872578 RepID=UPI003D6D64F5
MPSRRFQKVTGALRKEGQRHGALFKGLSLSSHFQPIYSLSHNRVVGHEGLLRAHDEHGGNVPPLDLFAGCVDEAEARWCDTLARAVHITNFSSAQAGDQWLFLNIRPQAILELASEDDGRYLQEVLRTLTMPAGQIVLELLESEIPDDGPFLQAMAKVRALGFLVALDDFGAGHSNFDRVWTIKPDIVKLDRSLLIDVTQDRSRQRVIAQMVSLLHECGSLVLMEGVETHEEALVALEADADFVQGYYFGRPQPDLLPIDLGTARITDLHASLADYREQRRRDQKLLVAPYQNAIGYAGALLSANRSMQEACQSFLSLPHVELCFVLDERGYQVGPNLWAEIQLPSREKTHGPLLQAEGACWARRPYFKRALQAPGKVQVTRPYRTLNGDRLSITASAAFRCRIDGQETWRVVCGDIIWDGGNSGLGRPLPNLDGL